MMTIDKFVKLIRQATRGTLDAPPYDKADFALNERGQIDSANEQCPIYELAYRLCDFDWEDVFQAGEALGLNRRSIRAIMNAADNKTHGPLRKRLLRACSL
jgi:hypothetical protein